ncbi:MAG: flagellar hook-length control protein FliK, partial [Lachnospiraceae bacterium]|nr:flagellar hook-length control protein FliK [Lachnospiraceae bacterium]
MAVKTVNVQSFDATMALGQTVSVKQAANNSSQSFGDVLNKASGKVADKNQTIAQNAGQKKPEANTNSEKAGASKDPMEKINNAEETAESSDVAQEAVGKKNVLDEKLNATEANDESDKMTTEQIADMLAQIIEQLKQLLGVSDEELLAGMESVGMQPADLLNTGNMAQLLTAIAGEGEAISFVTNEDLYAVLQEMTATVETVSSQLLEDMGLTQEELNALLEKLAQEESRQTVDLGEGFGATDMVNGDAALSQEEVPAMILEEDGKSGQAKTSEPQLMQNQYEELPENQQENPTEGMAKVQSQKSEHQAHGQEKSNDFNGQQGAVQNVDGNFNETTQVTAEAAVSYTSENVDSILKQLADFVKIVRNENLTEMELQLHPASLGTVNVSLVTKGGAVTAEFTTQNEAVRAAIESQVSQLITNLEEQGIKVEAVEVSVASHQMERNLEEDSQNDQSRQEQEERQRVHGARRNSINFNSFADGDEIAEEMQEADDATRIAME